MTFEEDIELKAKDNYYCFSTVLGASLRPFDIKPSGTWKST